MKHIILDLDNCIADDAWRIQFIDWPQDNMFRRYHNYHMLAPFDKLRNETLFANTDYNYWVFTSRPQFYHVTTMQWLIQNGLGDSNVMMRPDNFHGKTVQLKQIMLEQMLQHGGVDRKDIVCAYDDRNDIINMYKSLGVRAEQVKIHDINAHTANIEVPDGKIN